MSSWRVSFFALGGATLVTTVLLWRVLGETEPRSAGALRLRGVLAAYGPIRRHPPTLILTAATLAGNIGIWCTITYLTAFLVEHHGFGIQAVGWVWLAMGVTGLVGIVGTGGALGARPWPLLLGSRALTGLLLGAAFALPLDGPASAGLVVASVIVLRAGDMATTLALTAVSPAGRATTLTLNSAAICIGTALGGALGGLVLALAGYEALGLCSLIWLLLAAGLVWWSQPRLAPTPIAAPP